MRAWLKSHSHSFLYLITGITLLYYVAFIDSSSGDFSTISEGSIKMMKIIKERNSEEPIYIVGAYLIRDDLLRVVLITDCRTNSKFYASFFDNQSMIVAAAKNLSAMLDGCLTNACKYDGMYAEFEFPTKFVGDEVRLDIIDANNQSSLAMITVRRSVPPQQRKHRLAVCLPALFYYSDTVQLIEFIENWLLAGATKFYVYWQAITPAIKKVLLFYQKSGVDLELVAFPHLYNRTLDLLVYYTGQVISINDCLHKARSEAEFAAAVDLDELLVTNSTNLTTLLSKTLPSWTGCYLSRMHAHFDKEPVYSSNAQQLRFDRLSEIHSEKIGSAFTKLILRPENVYRSYVHWVNAADPPKRGILRLCTFRPSEAMLVHLRSFKENFNESKYEMSNILEKVSQNMAANWRLRLNVTDNKELLSLPITRSIPDIAQEMESCLLRLKGSAECFTASHCVPLLMTSTSTVVDWQYPEKEWIEM